MRLSLGLLLAMAALIGSSAGAFAQGPGPGGPAGGRPMNPLIRAIDANGDGELSADEIEKASTALKTLDKNNDGKLTDEELRPTPPAGGPGGGPGQRGAGGPGGPGGGRGGPGGPGEGGGPAPSVEEIIARYQSLDVNKDGKITKDEVPERMQGFITRADIDRDEVVTKEELTKMAERQAAGGGPRGESAPGAGGPGGTGGGGPRGGGGPGGFGPPNPQAFVERAMEFDADKDGKLSKEELAKLAEQMGGGRGGPGGPRNGGPPAQPRSPQ